MRFYTEAAGFIKTRGCTCSMKGCGSSSILIGVTRSRLAALTETGLRGLLLSAGWSTFRGASLNVPPKATREPQVCTPSLPRESQSTKLSNETVRRKNRLRQGEWTWLCRRYGYELIREECVGRRKLCLALLPRSYLEACCLTGSRFMRVERRSSTAKGLPIFTQCLTERVEGGGLSYWFL